MVSGQSWSQFEAGLVTDVLEQEVVRAPDLVRLEDYEQAIQILLDSGSRFVWRYSFTPEGWYRQERPDDEVIAKPGVVGSQWLARAADSLAYKVDRSFRDGPKVTTEQQAMAFVKGLAPHFLDASKALLKAAETFKAMGKALPANEAYLAHKRAAAKAQELNP
jgi:hypothetical protein